MKHRFFGWLTVLSLVFSIGCSEIEQGPEAAAPAANSPGEVVTPEMPSVAPTATPKANQPNNRVSLDDEQITMSMGKDEMCQRDTETGEMICTRDKAEIEAAIPDEVKEQFLRLQKEISEGESDSSVLNEES
jgi:hypothetical protein